MNTNRTGLAYSTPADIDTNLSNLMTEEARIEAELARVRAAQQPARTEYTNRGGWTRAYIVTGGHVHRSTGCSTLYPTTQIFWLPELSGKDEAEIVALAGERACTVCYPTAPVDVLSRPTQLWTEDEKAAQAARAERDQAKQDRAAKAAANAPTASGQPLVVHTASTWETFKTERAAMMWAVDAVENRLGYGMHDDGVTPRLPIDEDAMALVVTAVAEKRGVAADVVRAEIDRKGAAKAARWASVR